MRIRTMAALGIATAAVAGGLAIGGAAYAGGGDGNSPAVYQIVDERSTSTAPEDCPEKGGAGTGSEPGAGSDSGGTAPQETL
jgi:hypothetical protein